MRRRLNLRQVEAFKAVIEGGTISCGAEILNISQPAMSKAIAHLEQDTGLRLFDRVKGRLAPTEQAMRLYDEVGRIFAGVRQVENAVDAIRREDQGKLEIGVMTALAGSFIQRVTSSFLTQEPGVFCSIHALSSEWLVDRVIARKLDIAIVSARIANPYVILEPLMEHSLVCIMPHNHPLTKKNIVKPSDLSEVAFAAYHSDTYFGHRVSRMLTKHDVVPNTLLVANTAPTLCEFVASGLGIALVNPLTLSGLESRVSVRRFEPKIESFFQLCHSPDSRNARFVDVYAKELRKTASDISQAIFD